MKSEATLPRGLSSSLSRARPITTEAASPRLTMADSDR